MASVTIDRYRNRLEVYVNNLPLIDGHTGKIASFKNEWPSMGEELERVVTFLVETTEIDASSQTQSPDD